MGMSMGADGTRSLGDSGHGREERSLGPEAPSTVGGEKERTEHTVTRLGPLCPSRVV